VESVSWVAERKDVLSTLFWFLTMLGYVRYLQRPGLSRYLLVLLSFALGLMAKPMLVTLPIVLILMDFWPLRRLQPGQSGKESHGKVKESLAFHLVWEKAPLFALTALSSVVTFLAQQKGGAVRSLDAFPLDTRIANALVSYVSYIGKMIWPHDLAIYYPHQGALPLWQAAGAALVLLGLSALFLGGAWRRPYLAVGWLWYLVTLVPVIGLVQVGIQAMADRYTYIPLIGLFILIAWGVPDLMAAWRCRRVVLAISVAVALSGSTMCTWLQVRHWKNSITLFKHALNVIPDNALAHDALGIALAHQGRLDEAIRHYSEALRLKTYAETHINMGNALARQGRLDEAISSYSEALRLKPGYGKAQYNLERALRLMDKSAVSDGQDRRDLMSTSGYRSIR
jgi:tetratricopeptide (TPR) repeat protein